MPIPDILDALKFYGDSPQRRILIKEVIELLRNKEMNIKDWKLHEFAELVKEVANLEPNELRTFYNFTEASFAVDYYEMSTHNF